MTEKMKELLNRVSKEEKGEVLSLVAGAASADDIEKLAKDKGVELSADEAKLIFAEINEDKSLSVDDLDNVSGGSSCSEECGEDDRRKKEAERKQQGY